MDNQLANSLIERNLLSKNVVISANVEKQNMGGQKYFDNIAPTEYDPERGGIVHGKVHDENAYYLGGVSGNAGLFSTAWDLAKFAQMLLNKGQYSDQQIFNTSTVELFTKRGKIKSINFHRGIYRVYLIDRANGSGEYRFTPEEASEITVSIL